MKMFDEKLKKKVSEIIAEVRKNGDKALKRYSLKFDGFKVSASGFRVKDSEIKSAKSKLSSQMKRAIRNAAANIRRFHQKEYSMIKKRWEVTNAGLMVGQFYTPVESAGIYVSGGVYAYYPSIVLMCAIPARVAGVKKIVMTTPPANAIPEVLYAASVAGVDEVYRLGGAHAIAAFAYGTRSIPGVNIIAGPGSRYVTEAKRQVFGDVGIDLIAGPSEIAVICDDSADTAAVCADLLAQAEHSPDTRSYVFSDSESFLKALKKRLAIELRTAAARAPHLRTVQITFRRCTYDEAVHEVNRLAPEHLEIIHRKADAIAARVKNAGAIFIGSYSPVALGDYYAGPSHVLPTAGTARFSSGLSVRSFLKRTSVIKADARVLANAAPDIIRLAESEKLFMHAESIRRRIKRTGL